MTSEISCLANFTAFEPREYLAEYYADVGAENVALLKFFHKAVKSISPNSVLIDFGCGPTVYQLISAAINVKEVHLADYLDRNLDELRLWLDDEETAWDWTDFFKAVFRIEGANNADHSRIQKRHALVRKRITRLLKCDATQMPPVDDAIHKYDILTSNFCLESVTADRDEWRRLLQNMLSLLKPGGQLIMTALKGADSYHVFNTLFPVANVQESDLREALVQCGCDPSSIFIESVAADRPRRKYHGLMMAHAKKL